MNDAGPILTARQGVRKECVMKITYGQELQFTLIAAALLFASACSSRVMSDWRDASYQKKPGKILVLAMLNEPDRRLIEDELARQLGVSGINAVPGYPFILQGQLQNQNVRSAMVRESGADALLLIRVVERKNVREYLPGIPSRPQLPNLEWNDYYGRFYPTFEPSRPPDPPGGYRPRYDSGHYPGGTVETVYDIAEANLYDAETTKIVWSSLTRSLVQGGNLGEVESYASQIIKSLRKMDLIP